MSKHEADAPHLPIVEARFYDDLADALLDGAKQPWMRQGQPTTS
ncbi:6,7-dimethyl-8-ribityllumazine synthase [Brucella melitensis]|nr:6,7-dimethyl-8-ribityllumazine synthase [Brucella melitensis]